LHIERVIETHIHADFLSGHPVRPASDRRGGWPGWVGSLRLAAG
jgi:hypothetical protein